MEVEENICRICLDQNVALDWNNEIFEYCGTTYKDCYYQCTQLEYVDRDPFSPMLCHNCSIDLENAHTLILKALKSHQIFLDKFNHSLHLNDDSPRPADDIKYDTTEFETILVEKIELEDLNEQDYYGTPSSVQESNTAKSTNDKKSKVFDISFISGDETEDCFSNPTLKSENSEDDVSLTSKSEKKIKLSNKSTDSSTPKEDGNESKRFKLNDYNKVERKRKEQIDITVEDNSIDNNAKDDSGTQVALEVKTRYEEKPGMCSFCAKILKTKSMLLKHEKTHIENRERSETCPVCDLKFYNKSNLASHMYIHEKNREKEYKCEFCDKAFYKRGGLNVHRRIHLGQMVPCSLCSKEFFRQIDLERHMSSHSATTINTDEKKRSKYLVHCDYCDKSVLSTSFKAHRAAHLNEPLMKCSICNKEYFLKSSCIHHLKTVHHKTREESYNFITVYKTNQMSHLYLKQKANIQACDDN